MPHATPSRQLRRLAVILAGLAVVLAGCGAPAAEEAGAPEAGDVQTPAPGMDGPQPSEERVTVVATTSILGDIVQQLVGEVGEVTVLMPPGVDPHAYQPSAADVARLREADLVVANGLMLEESLAPVLAAAAEDGVRVLELADRLDPIAFGPGPDDEHGHDDDGHDDDGHDDDGHDDDGHGPEDPHVWFDPIRMTDGVELIAAELAEVWGAIGADVWQARADEYNAQLLAVHEEIEALFAPIPGEDRELVTNHDALGYLAHRYDLRIIATVIPGSSTQVETDARRFAALVETVEEAGASVIFAENIDRTVLAEQLASEVVGRGDLEIDVVRLHTDALGEEGSGAETYIGLLRTTARQIADALG